MSDPPQNDDRRHSGWRAGDEDDTPRRDAPPPTRFVLGTRFGQPDRGFEWRDGLGCYWFAGLLVVAVIWGWLNSIGVPQDVANGVGLVGVIGLLILFIVAARKARPPSS